MLQKSFSFSQSWLLFFFFPKGANVNAAKLHETALHHAAKTKNVDLIELLVEFGGNLYARDNLHKKPIHYTSLDSPSYLCLQFYESKCVCLVGKWFHCQHIDHPMPPLSLPLVQIPPSACSRSAEWLWEGCSGGEHVKRFPSWACHTASYGSFVMHHLQSLKSDHLRNLRPAIGGCSLAGVSPETANKIRFWPSVWFQNS